MTPRILGFACCEPQDVQLDDVAGVLVARFTAQFDLGSLGEVELPGWGLAQIGSQRFCLRTPVFGSCDATEQVTVPSAWSARLLARAIWRYLAETDPKAVEHLGAALRSDIGLDPATGGVRD